MTIVDSHQQTAIDEPVPGDGSVTFEHWINGRSLAAIGTNAGSTAIAFQTWKKFKEAFAPELIREAVSRSPVPVRRLLDPFGGSGTSALAAQFLGIHPTTIEVNPYLADVIEAKLSSYRTEDLRKNLEEVLADASTRTIQTSRFLPPTFIEPGVNSRYLFSREIADRVEAIVASIESIEDAAIGRLFRVALSGILLNYCNARVNGKGRRYRANWQKLVHDAGEFQAAFEDQVRLMITDIEKFGQRLEMGFSVLRGDSRKVDLGDYEADLVIFSPPYPNSFDYTDVYNIELWMLGYLNSWIDNGNLRSETLTSHVQVAREFRKAPAGSPTLERTLLELREKRSDLWDTRLPEMVEGYFADLWSVIGRMKEVLVQGGQMWMVVGDSRYSKTDVLVADIIVDLAPLSGLSVIEVRPFRSMRASPQQGGRAELLETLVVLQKL